MTPPKLLAIVHNIIEFLLRFMKLQMFSYISANDNWWSAVSPHLEQFPGEYILFV